MKKEKVIKWLDKMTEFSLWALIFTLPFSKTMVEIFFILALVCWVIKRFISYRQKKPKRKISGLIEAFKPERTDLNIPIAVFTFIAFLSTINSVSVLLSLEGFFFKLFEWIMIYFIVVETINDRKRLNSILGVIFFSIVLITIDGIFQFITGTDFIRNYQMIGGRVRASFGNTNSFAGWLMVMVPIVLSLAYFKTKRTVKSIFFIMAGLLIFCIALTYSRGVWIATILALIFFSIFIRSKKLFIIIMILLLILPFVAPDSIKKRAISITETPYEFERRDLLWQEALEIIADYPLVGCGLNTYAIVGPRYKIHRRTGYYPHNSYLHMAAEIGVLGLGAFIWIMVTLFKTSLTNLKKINDRFHSTILIGLLAGLFGFLLHSFVDTNIYALQLGNLMWFIMGLIVATQNLALK